MPPPRPRVVYLRYLAPTQSSSQVGGEVTFEELVIYHDKMTRKKYIKCLLGKIRYRMAVHKPPAGPGQSPQQKEITILIAIGHGTGTVTFTKNTKIRATTECRGQVILSAQIILNCVHYQIHNMQLIELSLYKEALPLQKGWEQVLLLSCQRRRQFSSNEKSYKAFLWNI